MKWKTKNSEEIKIKDMIDSHLLNTIAFMRKKYLERIQKLLDNTYLCAESSSGAVLDAFVCEISRLEYDLNNPDEQNETLMNESEIYSEMIKEAERRKLIKLRVP